MILMVCLGFFGCHVGDGLNHQPVQACLMFRQLLADDRCWRKDSMYFKWPPNSTHMGAHSDNFVSAHDIPLYIYIYISITVF